LNAIADARHDIPADQHTIAMHGRGGGIGRDANGGQLGIRRLQQTGTLPVHPDTARDKIGFQRKRVTIALFYTRNVTGSLETLKQALEKSLFVSRDRQPLHQLRRI